MGLEGQIRFVRTQAENGAKNFKCVMLLEKSGGEGRGLVNLFRSGIREGEAG